MIAQYAATVMVLSIPGFYIGSATASPFPNIVNGGDYLRAISFLVGASAVVVTLLAVIWSV
jgi:hypothetical protein